MLCVVDLTWSVFIVRTPPFLSKTRIKIKQIMDLCVVDILSCSNECIILLLSLDFCLAALDSNAERTMREGRRASARYVNKYPSAILKRVGFPRTTRSGYGAGDDGQDKPYDASPRVLVCVVQ